MGIISSKLAPVAIRLAWICQMLLDPRYSYTESIDGNKQSAASTRGSISAASTTSTRTTTKTTTTSTAMTTMTTTTAAATAATATATAAATITGNSVHSSRRQSSATPQRSHSPTKSLESAILPTPADSVTVTLANKLPENKNSLHQENRNRRAAQFRFKTRPSSFDATLIVRGRSKSAVIVASTPSPLRRQNMRMWDVTSSSGCSSDSGSNSESDSETELRVSENVSNDEAGTKLAMSAEEEEAFRLTLGRGHFSRSKKDRFLNHLRLEKRLNDLNNEYFGIACKNHRRTLQRRHSGDLHQII